MQLTDITVNMMVSILNDPEEPFTPELEQTATSITGCLTNIIKLAAGSSQDDTDLAVTLPTPEVKITRSVTTTTIVDQSFLHTFPSWSFFFAINSGQVSSKQNRIHIKRTKWQDQ